MEKPKPRKFKEGVLLVIHHQDKRVEQILIPSQAIYITSQKIDRKKVLLPTISLTDKHKVIRPLSIGLYNP